MSLKTFNVDSKPCLCGNYIKDILLIFVLSLAIIVPSSISANSFDGEVVRAFFTTAIKNNQPVNEVLILEDDVAQLYFYSEIHNMPGRTVFHAWEYDGKKVCEKKFTLSKGKERLISSCKLSKTKKGEWMVLIRDAQNNPIKAVMFKYVKKGSFVGKGIVPVK